MQSPAPESDDLLARAGAGDAAARSALLALHRQRLRQMIALRMDPRLRSRIDPSDVVQDALIDAHHHLGEYLEERPIPFYPWLRQLAFNRLLDLHRRHMLSQKRSVLREQHDLLPLSDESLTNLAEQFVASASSPSEKAMRAEECDRVRAALVELAERDREILVLRYLEKLNGEETAAVLGISVGAVKVRHFRALERIRGLLSSPPSESPE
jgi:RNA polymerase sigma-70 factor (ECF subfamily)